jgi:hypothetical protein
MLRVKYWIPKRRGRGALYAATVVGALAAMAAGACDAIDGATVESIYVVPASAEELAGATFFDHPFPSDLRKVDGFVRLAGYPNPRAVPLLDEYVGFMDGKLDGFSPVASGYVRFAGPLDPATLPDPAGALSGAAGVQLIDIDPSSPEHGSRRRILLQFQAEPGVYWPENTLAYIPVPGFPLRTHTRYAFVVTDAVRGADGGAVVAAPALRQVLGLEDGGSPQVSAARTALASDLSELGALGISSDRIVQLAVFTTNDPTEEFLAAARALPEAADLPRADAWSLVDETEPEFDEYVGSFGPSPNYQAGELPFRTFGDGGGFVPDEAGVPQIVDTFDLRFSLSVPKSSRCPMPAEGYPIVLYAHGTTGSYTSYVSDGTAASLTSQCMAVMGVDQIFHGTRPGTPDSDTAKQILFFNFNNIEAARTNARQSGLDEVHRARLFTEADTRVPASVSATGEEIRFDGNRLTFFGHSQGSLNGPLFLAGSDAPRGAVLSGASGVIQITLLEKTKPEPSVAALVKTLLALNVEEQAEVTLMHPPIALAQMIVDPVDPVNYGRLITSEPGVGVAKSIYMTEGIGPTGEGDSYAPPRGCEALAMSIGLPLMEPVIFAPKDAAWGGLERITLSAEGLSGNLAGGTASGILAQWDPGDRDGHFVVFNVDGATDQAAGFLRNLSDDPVGLIPAP